MAWKDNSHSIVQQVALKAAVELAVGYGNLGFLSSKEEADAFVASKMAEFTATLDERVTVDNTPVRNASAPAANTDAEDFTGREGEYPFTWGRNNGQTIAQVSESDAQYLTWLTETDSNPRRATARRYAQAYLDSRRAGV